MKWATRKNMQVDRSSSVWLINKFIDSEAEIDFVDECQIPILTKEGVLTFDAKEAKFKHLEDVEGGKYGEKCTFQIILDFYNLTKTDPALDYMGQIIYAADIGHRKNDFLPREGYGLWALTKGISIVMPDDKEKMDIITKLFDSLYAYCQYKVSLELEK